MYWRILKGAKFDKIVEADKQTTLFDMLPHQKKSEKGNKPNPKALKMQKTFWKQWRKNGLNNLKYKVREENSCRLFVRILADLYAPVSS